MNIYIYIYIYIYFFFFFFFFYGLPVGGKKNDVKKKKKLQELEWATAQFPGLVTIQQTIL